jgi:hypothetical protein
VRSWKRSLARVRDLLEARFKRKCRVLRNRRRKRPDDATGGKAADCGQDNKASYREESEWVLDV